ncbi:Panacea domain-containing protein [Clostridium sp. WILCCON 0269]|uniref:Panacea domain-containing protein n=1 Tax=Candidatus Clostridium eludens TaxID=3381663 RepID=A0ABW8SDQ9_9CLOT
MYDAMDIAEYVLNYCENELNKPITNLQLQKFLYYIQGYHLAEYKEPIFDNDIEAWAYGPVVPDVYYCYNANVSKKITGIELGAYIEPKDKDLINKVVNKLIDIPVWDLVDKTHKEEPWKINYISHSNIEIPLEDIKNCFIGKVNL